MVSRLVLIRHGRPELIEGVPPSTWRLADQSYDDVRRLSTRLGFVDRPLLLASTEPKAIETAEALGLGPVRSSGSFDEVRKPWYDDAAGHYDATASYLAGETPAGWERLDEAVKRFDDGLHGAVKYGDLVVVSHGTVMSAWLGSTDATADPFKFWTELKMPDAWEVDLEARTVWRLGS